MKRESSTAVGRISRRAGFTLIELIVVVAIIGILAALAIPNLLEAQTRAKAARVKADLKTVVVGIESYRIDHNGYPTYHYANSVHPDQDFHIGGKVPSFGVPDPSWDGRNPLTTPIAYLTSMPLDPFAPRWRPTPPETNQFWYVNWDYALSKVPPSNAYILRVFATARANYGAYRLDSRGPDLFGPDSGTPYDPTNGTVSRGDITYGPKTGLDRIVVF